MQKHKGIKQAFLRKIQTEKIEEVSVESQGSLTKTLSVPTDGSVEDLSEFNDNVCDIPHVSQFS